jgi:chemotaxis protein CheY-P-specific phosphatase CheC
MIIQQNHHQIKPIILIFIEFLHGGKNTTFHLLERLLMQRDALTEVLQLFGEKALSVLSTVTGVSAQFIIRFF